ncbi:right-handed parallel beta-helix repeat-containing protein, partial [bacterium]|nr:right-handed parallel beta-helix repeat-containing protein [bacterium]
MSRLTMILLSVFILILPLTAWSTVFYIDQGGGGDYTTISEGIAAASGGDTVLIAAGTYSDTLNTDLDFAGKSILVISESGPEVTIINCEYPGGPYRRAFFFHSGEDTTSIVDGLTITSGVAVYGGGINCTGAFPLIRNCVFTHCGVAYGGGMYFSNSTAIVRDCRFENNDVFVLGGALFCDNASPTITDCVIDSCTSGFIAGGVFLDNGGSTTLRDVSITNCYSAGDGGGMYCRDAPPYLERVEFIGNMADTLSNGGGMYTNCDATLIDCLFQDNFADNAGGGLWCTAASVDIADCTFSMNRTEGMGGGICTDDAMLQVTGGQFDNNEAFMGAGAYCFGAMPEMSGVLFAENEAYLIGGAIVCEESMATIDECIFTGNIGIEGAAIATYGSLSPSITNSTLSGNISVPGDAAIYAESDPSIMNTIIAFTESGGAVRCADGGLPSITHSCSFGNA